MNHPNLVVVHYNSYAGGKFWINCLSHNLHAVPGLSVADPQRPFDRWLLDDLDLEEIQRLKIARINSTLPVTDDLKNWCMFELGCAQFWGDTLENLLKNDCDIPATAIQLLDQYRCFIVNHRPQHGTIDQLVAKLPRSKHILLTNAENFQITSAAIKRSVHWNARHDTTTNHDNFFVVDVDNTYMHVDRTINRVKECLQYLDLDTALDPNIHSFVTRYFDLHR
jgi:hypothetical protein